LSEEEMERTKEEIIHGPGVMWKLWYSMIDWKNISFKHKQAELAKKYWVEIVSENGWQTLNIADEHIDLFDFVHSFVLDDIWNIAYSYKQNNKWYIFRSDTNESIAVFWIPYFLYFEDGDMYYKIISDKSRLYKNNKEFLYVPPTNLQWPWTSVHGMWIMYTHGWVPMIYSTYWYYSLQWNKLSWLGFEWWPMELPERWERKFYGMVSPPYVYKYYRAKVDPWKYSRSSRWKWLLECAY
jgi:hypothetical protein